MPQADNAEQTFFADPALDRLAAMVLALAGEVHVLQDRLASIETLLDGKGVLRREDLDAYVPDAAREAALATERRAYVKHLFEPLLGQLASKS
jgi:hypothetical protein